MKSASAAIRGVSRLWAPPPDLTLSEWADRYFQLSPEYSAEHGKWTTLPYQREPLDSISDPRVKRTVIKSGRQMLKSLAGMLAVAYYSHQDPCPILFVQPGQEDAESFSRERIAPMIRDNPELRGLFSEAKSRSSGNTLGQKQFPGGGLSIVGAGSPRTVARRTIRIVIFDEIDKYKPTSEGNVISIGRHCLTTFRHRGKELDTCTPTVAGSNIDRAYLESDQRELYIPCPACGHLQSLIGKFYKQVRFDATLPTREAQAATARYHCENCDAPWTDAERIAAVDKGKWIAKKPFNGIAGFWISQLYSPWRLLYEIVLEFLTKKDDPQELQTFVNCTLAENWVEPGEQLDWERLIERREDYAVGTVPKGGLFLVAGADVHPDRIEVEVVAYGRGRESWSVDYRILEGRTADQVGYYDQNQDYHPSPWEQLDGLMSELFPHELGQDLPISMLFIDSGYGANDVYQWVRRQSPARVVAAKGVLHSNLPVGQPSPVDVTIGGRKIKGGLKIRTVWTDFFKAEFYSDLKKRRPTPEEIEKGFGFPPGYCHFPKGKNYGDEHFRQICAEQLVTRTDKRGRAKREWEQTRARNEALDARILSRAAGWDRGMDRFQEKHWRNLEARLGVAAEPHPAIAPVAPVPAEAQPQPPAPAPAPRPAVHPILRRPRIIRSAYLNNRGY